MLSRCLALMIVPVLPFVPAVAPIGPAHAVNMIVAGTLASLLALGALVDDRARLGVAVVGAWVALMPFLLIDSTLLEEVISVSWGVATFALIAGPFSSPPRVARVPAAAAETAAPTVEPRLPLAA